MNFFPCDIDIYTIIKDIISLLLIPMIGMYFTNFYVTTKTQEIEEKKEQKLELNNKLKESLSNISRICNKFGFIFNVKTNEFELKIGNGLLFVHIPFILKEYDDVFDKPFFLVHWNNWINKNHLTKSIEEQKVAGIPFEDNCKDIEEYLKKLIIYRKKQNDKDIG